MTITLDDVHLGYGDVKVIDGVSFDIEAGQITTLLGPNGSGKTTLIRAIMGDKPCSSGTIAIDGRDVNDISLPEMSKIVSYVPQYFAGTAYSTVMEISLAGRAPYYDWKPSEEDLRIAEESIHTMELDDLIDRRMDELSGGQRQRAMIARSLSQTPKYFLFDEPTSSLDLRYQLGSMETMKGLIHKGEQSMVIAMHDLTTALRFSDKVILLKDGRIYRQGTPGDVITPESIRDVYGVKARIVEDDGELCVLPIETI